MIARGVAGPWGRPLLSVESRWRVAAATGLVVAVLAGGCGGGGPESGSSRPELRLVTYSAYVLDPGVEQDVERRLGVDLVLVQSGDSAESLAKAILSAGRPSGDVLFGVDTTNLAKAIDSDVFEAPTGARPPSWARVEGTDRLVAVDWGAVCVDYDAAWFAERGIEPPASLGDLLRADLRDLLVVPDPATSTPGTVFLAAIFESVPDPESYLRSLRGNGVAIAGSWDDAWFARYTVSGGDRPIVVSYASSPPAEVHFSEGALDEPRTAVATETCARQIEMAGVLRGTEHPELASRLLAEMTGAAWQQSLPLTNFVEPLRPLTPRPELFERFAPIPDSPIELDAGELGRSGDRWISAWRGVME